MATEAAQLNSWVLRANTLACVGLVVAIAYVVVKSAYLFVDTSAGSVPPAVYGTQTAASSTPSNNQRVDVGALALVHLFGEEGAKPAVQAQPKEVNAPKTHLSLQLEGVFVAEDENKSTAMISEARKESQLYHIGDKVPGNATLAAVFSDRVLLNTNGKLEALYFPETQSGGGLTRSNTMSNNGNRPRSVSARTGRMSGGRPAFGAPGSMPPGGMPTPEQTQQVVEALKQEISSDPQAVLSQFGLATNNGRGYRITDTSNPALVAMGARPGDVILTVNGQSVGDPQADVNLLQQVMQSGCLKVGMEHSGRQYSTETCFGQ